MQKESIRQKQIGTLIQREMSVVLQKIGQNLFDGALVTVTQVKMSSDLMLSRVYLSIYNSVDKSVIMKALSQNLSQIRWEVGNRVSKQMRRIPLFELHLDETLDEVDKINIMLAKIHAEDETVKALRDPNHDATEGYEK
jgi:ribosome-binding factor A